MEIFGRKISIGKGALAWIAMQFVLFVLVSSVWAQPAGGDPPQPTELPTAFDGYYQSFGTYTGHLMTKPVCEMGGTEPLKNNSWGGVAIIALVLNFLAVGGVYALSGMGHTAKLRAWCKDALYGCITSAIILSIALVAFEGMRAFGKNELDSAMTYSHTMRGTMVMNFSLLMILGLFASFLSQSPSFAVFGYGLRFSTAPLMKPIFDMLGIIMNVTITAIGEWFAQEYFLCFIQFNMMTWFFPIGIFLRAFSATKSLGNTMMAVALAFFFIYPFMLNMNAQIIGDRYGAPVLVPADGNILNSSARHDCDPQVDTACVYWANFGEIISAMVNGLGLPWHEFTNAGNIGKGLIILIAWFMTSFFRLFGAGVITALVAGIPVLIEHIAYFVVVASLILPIFNIFVTITIAMEIAKVLGTEIDLSAIEKLL